jgi:hypothetical protein
VVPPLLNGRIYWEINSEQMKLRLSIVFAVFFFGMNSCGMKQQYELYQAVEKGQRLEEVNEIDLATFISKWMTKDKDERGLTVSEIHSNSDFSFFQFRGDSIYKVKQSLLSTVDYKAIDGDSIRHQFSKTIIPTTDHIKCEGGGSYNSEYTYSTDLEKKEITIVLHYIIRCEFIKKLDKTYKAVYSYEKKTLTPIP